MTVTSNQPALATPEFAGPSTMAAARNAFQRRWRRVALLSGAADQLDILAKITIAASIAYAIAILTINLRTLGWGWWAGALVLMAGGLGWSVVRTKHKPRNLRRVVVLGSAILLASLSTDAMWWAVVICAIGAAGAIYRRPRGPQLADGIDAMQHWPSTASAAVSLLHTPPTLTHPVEQGFARQLYQRAGEGFAAITASALLRPRDVGRQWAIALLFLIAAVVCGNLFPTGYSADSVTPERTSRPAIHGHHPAAAAGFATAHHRQAAPRAPAPVSPTQSARSEGHTAADHRRNSSERMHTTGKVSATTRQLRANVITARQMLTQLEGVPTKRGLNVALGKRMTAQLSRELREIKPLGAEPALAQAIKHELTASNKGRAGPLMRLLRTQIQELAQRNLTRLQAIELPTGGSQGENFSEKAPGQTYPTGRQPRSGEGGRHRHSISGTNPRTRHADHLIPYDHLAPSAHDLTRYAASGVRIYTFDVPGKMAGGTAERSLWRDAARALASETGYTPHRYRAIIRHYFSAIPSAR